MVDGVLSERSAGGVVLSGAAGVGKTRLAVEAAESADAAGYALHWVRATRSAASMPLGAFATLAPPLEGPVAVAGLLAAVRRALVALAAGRPLALCVDDAHLLDAGSAALLHQLVLAGEAFVVVTVRAGEPVPDAVRALWKDELCLFVHVAELSRAAVERLLGAVLGGLVDGRSANRLWALTRGNVLFLRELVLHGFEHGGLAEEGGIWRWHGDVRHGVRLGDLVGARVGELDPGALEVLEVLAVGAPLEVGLLAARDAGLEVLELRAIAAPRIAGRRRYLDLMHPLHGEVVRGRLARSRLEAIQGRLADAVEGSGARRRGDVLRVAAWRLESGAGDPALFVRAAEQALAALDWTLASRFARAAVQAGGGFAARLALAQALAGVGDALEAEELFGALERESSADAERARVAIARARNLFWGLDRASDAYDALFAAEQTISDPALRDELVALRARLASAQGRPLAALAAAEPLISSMHAAEQARLRAAIAVSEAHWLRGRTAEAVAVVEAWEPVAQRHREDLPLVEPQLIGARVFALWLAGRLVEATQAAERGYELELARQAQNTAVAALEQGLVWLARGRVRTALRWFRESAALLRDADTIGMRPWAVAGIAQAAAQAGDAPVARAAALELEGVPRRGNGLYVAELKLARAWSAAAGGELSRARELALAAADHADARGQDGLALRALHELTRLGGPSAAAPRLAALADRVDGPFAAIAAAHAAALAERDGGALMDVAERFAAQDALLLAAEAAGAAAAAHRQAGREASARAAASRAAVLLEDCEGARPPTLLEARLAAELTAREREIAMLAASGLSSKAIAERLVVSVRTVDNHLQRTYRKLGISRRDELAPLLTPRPE